MKKILTISEPNCGAKPTGYAAVIPNDNRDTLKAEIAKGLMKGWYFGEAMAEGAAMDEDIDALKESGYTYIPGDGVDKSVCGCAEGRFLVEVTILDEEGTEPKGGTQTYVQPFATLSVECDVDWDCDADEVPPDRDFEVKFTPRELEHFGVLNTEDASEWILDEDKFKEFMGEYLTDYTDFCHKGFTYHYSYK